VVKLSLAPPDPIPGRWTSPPPLPDIVDGEEEWVVEEILDSQMVNVKLRIRTEMSGPKSCEALASTCGLRRSLAGCLEFWRSGRSRRVQSRAEKKLKKTRASKGEVGC